MMRHPVQGASRKNSAASAQFDLHAAGRSVPAESAGASSGSAHDVSLAAAAVSEARSNRRLLTVQEAARFLSVAVSTLYGWVWQRRIPFVKIGRALRFDMHDLEDFIAANKQATQQSRS